LLAITNQNIKFLCKHRRTSYQKSSTRVCGKLWHKRIKDKEQKSSS